mmetsp:Transcript_11261/g.25253  ORF Transcript_11261/g.25253 Transcript_11261/m.25253 type:complete len:86 (+) Transcript_11261:57-314(+)
MTFSPKLGRVRTVTAERDTNLLVFILLPFFFHLARWRWASLQASWYLCQGSAVSVGLGLPRSMRISASNTQLLGASRNHGPRGLK